MKFGATWKQRVQGLPPAFRDDTIQYKHLKKTTKTSPSPSPTEIMLQLQKECERVHRRFLHEIRFVTSHHHPNPVKPLATMLMGFCKRSCAANQVAPQDVSADAHDLYEFAELNRTCLYKLCKRYDKRLQTNTLRPWLSQVMSEGSYSFLNRLHLRILELQLYGPTEDDYCPICFDPPQSTSPVILLNCGHLLCLQCTLQLYRAENINGTLRNRIALGEHVYRPCCPVCRHPRPLQNMTARNIFPPHFADLLHKLNDAPTPRSSGFALHPSGHP